MGSPKLVLPWGDGTIISNVISRVFSMMDEVVVVTGHQAAATADALADFDVQFIHNPDYAAGEMISSVKVGVAALPRDVDAFFLVLGDQPGIRPETFTQLIDASRAAMIVSPSWNNRRGHPVLISAAGIDEILNLPADATLKTFVSRHAGSSIEIPVDDPAVCADVDTPEQYQDRVGATPASPGARSRQEGDAGVAPTWSASCPTETIAAAAD